MATVEQFAIEEYADELARAEQNAEVGTMLLYENERIHDLENTGDTTFRFHTLELLA
jgi:hypothetical protein